MPPPTWHTPHLSHSHMMGLFWSFKAPLWVVLTAANRNIMTGKTCEVLSVGFLGFHKFSSPSK